MVQQRRLFVTNTNSPQASNQANPPPYQNPQLTQKKDSFTSLKQHKVSFPSRQLPSHLESLDRSTSLIAGTPSLRLVEPRNSCLNAIPSLKKIEPPNGLVVKEDKYSSLMNFEK
jgi:hypothetical protein